MKGANKKRWRILLKLNPWTRWAYKGYVSYRFVRRTKAIKLARLTRIVKRLGKLLPRYQQGELKVIAKISKLIGAGVGIVVSWAFLQLPILTSFGVDAESVTGALTTLIITGLTTYFAPKNA